MISAGSASSPRPQGLSSPPAGGARARAFALVLLASLLFGAAPRAWAVGEIVTDLRIKDNVRTHEDAIRSLAGIEIGDILEADTLEVVRERLHSSGLFAEVNVYWEPYRYGVRIHISVKDKIPWAPVPTFSYSPGNTSAGLVLAHGNLFGRGKRALVGGRLSTADSAAFVAYQDPAFLGSWLFWEARGRFADRVLEEYGNLQGVNPVAIRETELRNWSFSGTLGVAWFRRIKTAVGWTYEHTRVLRSEANPEYPSPLPGLPPAAVGGRRGVGEASLTFDFRGREYAVLYGNALTFSASRASPLFGADRKFTYWKAGAEYEHGIRLFRSHNIIAKLNAVTGEDLPLWVESYVGGHNLRGYVYRQFTGDSQLSAQLEYHFPLFTLWDVQTRGLVFSDGAAVWWRDLPPLTASGEYQQRGDGRSYLPRQYQVQGFDRDRDIHGSAGAGLRFFVKWIAAPLVGVDFARGLGSGAPWRMVLVIGA